MPMNIKDYPPNWREISQAIRFDRAAGRCEWSDGEQCEARHNQPSPYTGTLVILTTAHICECRPKCGDEAHLYALCQKHHLWLDLPQHKRNAAETRRRRKIKAGQMEVQL